MGGGKGEMQDRENMEEDEDMREDEDGEMMGEEEEEEEEEDFSEEETEEELRERFKFTPESDVSDQGKRLLALSS